LPQASPVVLLASSQAWHFHNNYFVLSFGTYHTKSNTFLTREVPRQGEIWLAGTPQIWLLVGADDFFISQPSLLPRFSDNWLFTKKRETTFPELVGIEIEVVGERELTNQITVWLEIPYF